MQLNRRKQRERSLTEGKKKATRHIQHNTSNFLLCSLCFLLFNSSRNQPGFGIAMACNTRTAPAEISAQPAQSGG